VIERSRGESFAGGNKHPDYISKEDASSPTVATEAVILSCIIDAEEGRDFAVVDIPNTFVHTRVENEKDMAFIKIRGVLVDILVEIAPDVYKLYVSREKKGTKQLLVQCQHFLYGTMVASLLYYRKFVKSLTDIGFIINHYDLCVANKIIEGKQMTICFHVDNFKLSHCKKKVMDTMIEYLHKEYESILKDGTGAMTVSRDKIHRYLGMNLNYNTQGQVNITMFDYIDKFLTAFDKAEPKGGGTKTSAAPDSLFKVEESCKKLAQNKAMESHNLVAKTLYVTKRARPDTCTAIAYLTTRVRESDKDGLTNLVHLAIHQRHSYDAADLACQWKWHFEMVGGRVSSGPYQHAWALRSPWRAPHGDHDLESHLLAFEIDLNTAIDSRPPNHKDKLTYYERRALKKLRHDPSLLICDSDKNLGPAVTTKITYLKAIYADHLSTNAYEQLTEVQASHLNHTTRTKLNLISQSITKKEEKTYLLRASRTKKRIHHLYGIPKLHKDSLKWRPIVSCVNGVTEAASKWLDHQMHRLLPYIYT
jgi:hypothetical protein